MVSAGRAVRLDTEPPPRRHRELATGRSPRPPRGREQGAEGGSREEPRPVRVLIVDDHKLFAEGVRPALRRAGLEVVDPAANGREALEVIRRLPPDLVLVDLGLPDMSGIDLGAEILKGWPRVKVVALTAMRDPRAVQEALKAGFHGYLTKDMPLSHFLKSVVAALEGQVIIPHRLAAGAAGARSLEEEHADLVRDRLTPREFEVLRLLAEGLSTKQMAKLLSLSPNTVRTHVQNILEKFQVGSRLEAVAFATRHRLVSPPGHRP
jgi:NarL family two-component system response regulator LiaR